MHKIITTAIAALFVIGTTKTYAEISFVGAENPNLVKGNEINVHFSGTINHHKIAELQSTLANININNPDTKRVNLLINSWGGEVNASYEAYWAIKSSTIPVRTINVGVAGSAAVAIYCAGKERATVDGAYFFIHPIGVDLVEHLKPDTTKKLTKHFELMHAAQSKVYKACMTLSDDELDTMFKSEFYSRYVSDVEAVKMKLSDKVLTTLPSSTASAYIYDHPKDNGKN